MTFTFNDHAHLHSEIKYQQKIAETIFCKDVNNKTCYPYPYILLTDMRYSFRDFLSEKQDGH